MSPDDIEAQLRQLTPSDVTLLARAALRSDAPAVVAWQWQPLRTNLGIATGGLYRVYGTVRGGDGPMQEWAVVLKVVRPPGGTRHDATARVPQHWA